MTDTQLSSLTIIQASRALRLAGAAKHVGPHVFDDAESFDAVFGRGSFAEYDRCTLDTARAVVEGALDQKRRLVWRVNLGETGGGDRNGMRRPVAASSSCRFVPAASGFAIPRDA